MRACVRVMCVRECVRACVCDNDTISSPVNSLDVSCSIKSNQIW